MSTRIEVPFEVDQPVWVLMQEDYSHYHDVTCGFCGGDKRVRGRDGKERVCPDCEGKGIVSEKMPPMWFVANHGNDDYDPSDIYLNAIHLQRPGARLDEPVEIRLGLRFPSGTGYNDFCSYDPDDCFSPSDVFASEAEAIAECQRRNDLLPKHEDDDEVTTVRGPKKANW